MHNLSERKLKILSAIVEMYIKTGEPVGSKALSSVLNFTASPATIRNEMAELVELGLLEQPHTSAGRIPSSQGYRFYINEIMNPKPISDKEQRFIYGNLNVAHFSAEELINRALKLLAEATNLVALSTNPKQLNSKISSVQAIQTGPKSGIVILIISSDDVVTANFQCEYELNAELIKIYNRMLIQIFKNIAITSVNEDFIRKSLLSMGEISIIMSPVLKAVLKAANEALKTQLSLQGQTNLLLLPEYDLTSAKQTLDFLNREEDLVAFTELDNNTTKIIIGNETQCPELVNSSIVLSKYFIGNNKSGVIGVVGPKRMDYAKTVAQIKYLAKIIGELLDSDDDSEYQTI
ncbi:MAG: heat-inducible transcriptional repressor HrcA [Clostridia bacterium]|nr:heat-inducible transcriptional repressor HrcA [Clostridia bacterium]